MSSKALYDRIGRGYSPIRQADPRFAAAIRRALGDARSVVNVGAGAGSYEPRDLDVTAVEPSSVMIAQRPPGAAPVVQASAEQLPFPDDSFDAAMAVVTIHHWRDANAGLAELRRVARRRVVVLCFDYRVCEQSWLVRDYLPEMVAVQRASYPQVDSVCASLPGATVEALPAPRDCTDRMFATLWARPEEHLDPIVRAGTSAWDAVPPEAAERAVAALRRDLETGAWDERHGHLRTLPELDVGLRLIRAEMSLD
ncbi:MAG TPA: class I SAM-dependent methyltransferase [Gaiellaceae bacterium]|nr:class I SAM-dependent methyltransferase [Gaiellaceae bacterium]